MHGHSSGKGNEEELSEQRNQQVWVFPKRMPDIGSMMVACHRVLWPWHWPAHSAFPMADSPTTTLSPLPPDTSGPSALDPGP